MTALAVLTAPIYARADSAPMILAGGETFLATRHAFTIDIIDQVTDGCLPDPKALSDRMEASLRRNKFEIVSEVGLFTSDITINAVGYKSSVGLCIVYMEVFLTYPAFANVPYSGTEDGLAQTLLTVRHSLAGNLLSGPSDGMQKRLSDVVEESAQKVFLDVSRARDKIFSKYPALKAAYEAKTKQ